MLNLLLKSLVDQIVLLIVVLSNLSIAWKLHSDLSELRGGWSDNNVGHWEHITSLFLFLHRNFIIIILLLVGLLNRLRFEESFSFDEFSLVISLVSTELLAEFEHVRWLHLGSLWVNSVRELCYSLVGQKGIWLNFILHSLILWKSVSGDWSINYRTKVWVFFDDWCLASLVDILSCFEHLSKNLDSLSLDLSDTSFFVLSLLESDHIDSLLVLIFRFLLSFYQGWLKEVESLILNSLNVLFSFSPFSNLLLFH